jgi:excisionase family DNA binding protein
LESGRKGGRKKRFRSPLSAWGIYRVSDIDRANCLEEENDSMSDPNGMRILDSNPCALLTIGELRQVIRTELLGVLGKYGGLQERRTSSSPNQSIATKPYLTVKEAAELARLADSTIRLYIRKGKLKRQKVGRRIIISRIELEKFLGLDSKKVVELFPT